MVSGGKGLECRGKGLGFFVVVKEPHPVIKAGTRYENAYRIYIYIYIHTHYVYMIILREKSGVLHCCCWCNCLCRKRSGY